MRPSAKAAARSAAEGALAAVFVGVVAVFVLGVEARFYTALGLALAWAVSTASVAAVFAAGLGSRRAFWWAFGGGMALRLFVFAAVAAWSWGRPSAVQSSLLASYTLGLLALLLIEYRHLSDIEP